MYPFVAAKESFWYNKNILAPMVRVSILPVRMLAYRYGADIVYGPEVVDLKLIGCDRRINPVLGTIDFFNKGRVFFRCLPEERNRLVFQIGSSDPVRAVAATRIVHADVCAVDLNCGCPKHFSVHSGMGAALLDDPERLCAILSALVADERLPVCAKIRILPDRAQTISLAKKLAKTGITALTVHCRTRNQRPNEPGDWSVFHELGAALAGSGVSVIANGDIKCPKDAAVVKDIPGISAVMLARAAQRNPAIFFSIKNINKEGPQTKDLIIEYLSLAFRYCSCAASIKFIITSILSNATKTEKELMKTDSENNNMLAELANGLSKAKTVREIAILWEMESDYDSVSKDLWERSREAAKIISLSENDQKIDIDEISNSFLLPETL